MTVFDDSWLEDRAGAGGADPILRRLAEAGARVRRETADAQSSRSASCAELPRPRAVIAAGIEARFIRAMLEPVCPVPFVAWPTHGLPGLGRRAGPGRRDGQRRRRRPGWSPRCTRPYAGARSC